MNSNTNLNQNVQNVDNEKLKELEQLTENYEQSKPVYTRRQRRLMMKYSGLMRQKNSMQPMSEEWCEFLRERQNEGKALHKEHLERIEKVQEDNLEKRRAEMAERMKSEGYNKRQIKKAVEIFTL